MKLRNVLLFTALFGMVACQDSRDTTHQDRDDIDYEYPNPETNPTAGQRLDTAIQDTRDAANRAGEEVKEFGQDVKAKADQAGRDIKQEARETRDDLRN